MAIKFVDRVPTHPNRIKFTGEDGTVKYGVWERADSPTVVGTPINAANLNAMQQSAGLSSNMAVFVSTTGSDNTGNGTNGMPYATIAKALNSLPKNLNGFAATVYIAGGTYDEEIQVWGFHGGSIIITGAEGAVVTARSLSVGQTASLRIENINLTLTYPAEVFAAYIVEATVNMRSGKLTINSTSPGGVFANTGALLYITDLIVSNVQHYCVTASNNASVHIQNATLATSGTGLVSSYGGVITYHAVTNNATIKTSTISGGRIYTGAQTSIPNY